MARQLLRDGWPVMGGRRLRRQPISRRHFIGSTPSAAAAGYFSLLRPGWAASGLRGGIEPAGQVGQLRATDPGGIDLYLEQRELLIGGRPGISFPSIPAGETFAYRYPVKIKIEPDRRKQ